MSNNDNQREKEIARIKLGKIRAELQPILDDLVDMNIPVFTAVLDQTSKIVLTNGYHNWGKNDGFDILLSLWYLSEVQNGRFSPKTANAVVDMTQKDIKAVITDINFFR